MKTSEKSPESWLTGPEERHFQFVIVVLDDSRPEDVPKTLGKVAEVILDHSGIISNISSSIVVACLGVPFEQEDSVEKRHGLVDALITEIGSCIRLGHGQCTGNVGNLGCKNRFVYEAVIPGFNGILKRLLDSPAGAVIEVSSTHES